MSGIKLWQDEDLDIENEDEELYDFPNYFEDDPDNDSLEDMDIFCKECGALVEDGFQCNICGLIVEA